MGAGVGVAVGEAVCVYVGSAVAVSVAVGLCVAGAVGGGVAVPGLHAANSNAPAVSVSAAFVPAFLALLGISSRDVAMIALPKVPDGGTNQLLVSLNRL